MYASKNPCTDANEIVIFLNSFGVECEICDDAIYASGEDGTTATIHNFFEAYQYIYGIEDHFISQRS